MNAVCEGWFLSRVLLLGGRKIYLAVLQDPWLNKILIKTLSECSLNFKKEPEIFEISKKSLKKIISLKAFFIKLDSLKSFRKKIAWLKTQWLCVIELLEIIDKEFKSQCFISTN